MATAQSALRELPADRMNILQTVSADLNPLDTTEFGLCIQIHLRPKIELAIRLL